MSVFLIIVIVLLVVVVLFAAWLLCKIGKDS